MKNIFDKIGLWIISIGLLYNTQLIANGEAVPDGLMIMIAIFSLVCFIVGSIIKE